VDLPKTKSLAVNDFTSGALPLSVNGTSLLNSLIKEVGAQKVSQIIMQLAALTNNKKVCFHEQKCIFEYYRGVKTINNHYNYNIFCVKNLPCPPCQSCPLLSYRCNTQISAVPFHSWLIF
jgi:hypothetical protein